VKPVRYTYTIIRYIHDRAAGETLNVGVLVMAPAEQYVGLEIEPRFERLSRTFSGFDGDVYRQTLLRLRDSVQQLRPRVGELIGLAVLPSDASDLLRSIWPDLDLSFSCGPLMSGITQESLEHVTGELFRRMVASQVPSKGEAERRSDEEVWAVYHKPLIKAKISHYLVEKVLRTADYEIKFDHAFQNRKLHAIQPVTMDFVRPESLQDKATRWLGTAAALKGNPMLAKVYFLLGEPRNESHRHAYNKAKNLLHKMELEHELVEERDAEAFALELAAFMREHGIEVDER
jgi:hypothetical protein